jgi:nucleotide-binding universal stress UspA family protein
VQRQRLTAVLGGLGTTSRRSAALAASPGWKEIAMNPDAKEAQHRAAGGSERGLPLKRILHPSGLSPASEVAFAHALRLALATGAELRVLHAEDGAVAPWVEHAFVRRTLVRWGLLPEGATSEEFDQLGLAVTKVVTLGQPPIESILQELEQSPADLIVLSTRRLEGLKRWVDDEAAVPASRKSRAMTLFVPDRGSGFVSPADGRVSLRDILLAVDWKPPAQAAAGAATGLALALGLEQLSFTQMHVGEGSEMPPVELEERAGWHRSTVLREGEPADEILAAARSGAADLIVLATEGPHGLRDALRGSTTERVVHGAYCPVLSVPV